jgi:hypothetical protein
MPFEKGYRGLFTGVRGRRILRPSPLRRSRKFTPRNSYLAYKDSPFGGCALGLLRSTISTLLSQSAPHPLEDQRIGFSLACAPAYADSYVQRAPLWRVVHKILIIPTGRIMAPPRQGTPDRGEAVFFPRSLQKIPKILARNGCRNVQETLARYGSEVRSLAGAERMIKA